MDAENGTDICPLSYPVTSSAKPSSKSMVPKFVFWEEDSFAVDEADGGANRVYLQKGTASIPLHPLLQRLW